MTKITVDVPNIEAQALAQFVKRTSFDDCQRLGSRYDGGEEAEAMWRAVQALQRGLAEAGFAPR